ncbi:MAG TPA: trehalose-6-phosphate synthase [Gemmatimonadales bacterium]|nr:trehalose-6-phosphate synthase [Gemmatimonadales bacterium]
MRLSLRFIVPLLLALAAIAYAILPLVDKLTVRWFVRDLDLRANLIANSIRESDLDLAAAGNRARLIQFFTRITEDERVYAVGVCAGGDERILATAAMPADVSCSDLDRYSGPTGYILRIPQGPLLVSVRPLEIPAWPHGRLVLVHDMSFVQLRSEETRRYVFYFFVLLGVTISLITVVIAQVSWRGWEAGMRALLRGEGLLRASESSPKPEFRPLARDLRELVRDIEAGQRPRDEGQTVWTAEALRATLHEDLRGQEVIVVSNREPFLHVYRGDAIEVHRPASGLVTALEPIMRACSGTWVAHGSGSADRAVVDRHDRVSVPPDHPAYQIRRVWLSPEEEAGYYYGFANEGLWPLCHIAHVRPTFRTSDWEQYARVNRAFAAAVSDEVRSADPIVLVQDYHFALLPRMIRQQLPAATIVTFWHIPWPNPEAFGICPWREELLDGLLGSSILGFHTQFHCNNFVDTVDSLLEARTDRESFTVSYQGSRTAVKRYPISVEWPPPAELMERTVEECRIAVRRRHGLPESHRIGVGVDRLDYTKGVEERLRAVERLFELRPEWIGRFTFVQVAAPTRTSIEEYRHYQHRVESLVARINQRFESAEHPAILLLGDHHEPHQVYEYYRAAEVCVVSSLHDGMNLVAKEFVSSRDDERGVLVLSQFTGAARELPEALIVNPYDTDECAAALHMALVMPEGEERARMRLMRALIREFNVFRWAGRMLIDAAGLQRRGRLLERVSAAGGRALAVSRLL